MERAMLFFSAGENTSAAKCVRHILSKNKLVFRHQLHVITEYLKLKYHRIPHTTFTIQVSHNTS